MFKSVKVMHDNKDIIHDVAYDFHGKRIATCSSDQSVKVYDLNEKGQWHCTSNWKTHSGSVWRVAWAHPEFGQILATCSFDRTAIIWEEVEVSEWSESTALLTDAGCCSVPVSASDPRHTAESGAEHGRIDQGRTFWAKRASLVDSRSNVTDVKFAPPHLGLQLATCSANGIIRIYDCPDIMSLNTVHLQHELSVGKHRTSCISWNPSKYHPPLIAAGCDEPNVPSVLKVTIFELNTRASKWSKVEALSMLTDPVYDLQFAPNCGRSYHLLAVGSREVHIFQLTPLPASQGSDEQSETPHTRFDVRQVANFDAHNGQVWRVSWNVTGTILSTAGSDGTVKLWKSNYKDNWKELSTIKPNDDELAQALTTASAFY